MLCLQDVESFQHWWGPQLTGAGYDSLYKQRTSRAGVRRDGVVIAWKRDVFDLLRSEELELNRSHINKDPIYIYGRSLIEMYSPPGYGSGGGGAGYSDSRT